MKALVLAVKVVISGLLTWLLIRHVDVTSLADFLKSPNALLALAFCIALFLIQAGLAAIRLRWIMRLFGAECPVYTAFSIWMIGLLISQTLVTFVAGDAARIWQLTRLGHGRRLATGAIFLERTLGLVVLVVMVLICIPFLLARAPDGAVHDGLVVLAALCVAGTVGFVASGFLGRLLAQFAPRLYAQRLAAAAVDIASAARHLTTSWKLSTGISVLSVVMHLCNALAFFILAGVAGINLDFVTNAAVSLPVMLIALLPISLAGWGVREGSAVVGYGLFGVAAGAAVAISVVFGLALLIASLPGGYYLWSNASRRALDGLQTEQESRAL